MTYLKTIAPEAAVGQLKNTYTMLDEMFQMVPQVFVAQSLRPDLLEPLVVYVKQLMVETRALDRTAKELIAAHVSKLNQCAY